MSKRRDPSIPEIPQGSLGAAAMAAFHMSERAAMLCFAKGNISIDGQALNSTHLRSDAEPYRGCYLQFYEQQALILGHRLVRQNEQLSLRLTCRLLALPLQAVLWLDDNYGGNRRA